MVWPWEENDRNMGVHWDWCELFHLCLEPTVDGWNFWPVIKCTWYNLEICFLICGAYWCLIMPMQPLFNLGLNVIATLYIKGILSQSRRWYTGLYGLLPVRFCHVQRNARKWNPLLCFSHGWCWSLQFDCGVGHIQDEWGTAQKAFTGGVWKVTFDVWAYKRWPQLNVCHPPCSFAGCPAGSCEVESWYQADQERTRFTSNMSADIRLFYICLYWFYTCKPVWHIPFSHFATWFYPKVRKQSEKEIRPPQVLCLQKQWWTMVVLHLFWHHIPIYINANIIYLEIFLFTCHQVYCWS